MSQPVSHKAIVEAVEPHWVNVVMQVDGACAGCHARHICGSGEQRERRITVHTPDAERYHVGEQVVVGIERSMSLKAVAWAYLLPLILMMSGLWVMLGQGMTEAAAGVTALSMIALYYLCLYLFRDKIGREIVFTLSKSE